MADIDGYLKIIREGTDGDSVRDAIIDCMNAINQDGYIKRVPVEKVHDMGDDSSWDYTMKAPNGQAYSQVHIVVTREGGSGSETKSVGKTVVVNNETPPGEIRPEEGEYIECVDVQTDFSSLMSDDIVENVVINRSMLAYDERYPKGGTYSCAIDGWKAMQSITFEDIAGTGSGGTIGPGGVIYYNVKFVGIDGKQIGDTISVPANGSISDVGKVPPQEGAYSNLPATDPKTGAPFDGWSGGNYASVTKDLTLTPIYKFHSGEGGSIEADWEDIIAHPGDFEVGGTKVYTNLSVDIPEITLFSGASNSSGNQPKQATFAATRVPGGAFSVEFMIVARNELGSHLTFLSTQPVKLWTMTREWDHDTDRWNVVSGHYGTDQYHTSIFQKFLDNVFLPMMFKNHKLNNAIIAVRKKTHAIQSIDITESMYNQGESYINNIQSNIKLWMPAMSELRHLCGDAMNDHRLADNYSIKNENFWQTDESGAIVYTDWKPKNLYTYGNDVYIPTRTLNLSSGMNSGIGYRCSNIFWNSPQSLEDLTPENAYVVNNGYFGNVNYSPGFYLGFCI